MTLRNLFNFFKPDPAKIDVIKLTNQIQEKAVYFGVVKKNPVTTGDEALRLIKKISLNPHYFDAYEKKNLGWQWLGQIAHHFQEDFEKGSIIGSMFGIYLASTQISPATLLSIVRALVGTTFGAAFTFSLVVGPLVRMRLDYAKAHDLEKDISLLQQAFAAGNFIKRATVRQKHGINLVDGH